MTDVPRPEGLSQNEHTQFIANLAINQVVADTTRNSLDVMDAVVQCHVQTLNAFSAVVAKQFAACQSMGEVADCVRQLNSIYPFRVPPEPAQEPEKQE